MRIQLDPLRGFRDILPPESEELSSLVQVFSELAARHGYREVKPPTLERFELFAIKSGEEIRNTMYTFRDKAGREVALRPEATASIARIYLRHLKASPKPIRVYYVVNCFRYENPQHARYREFWQAGVELLGVPELWGDFEPIKLLLTFYKRIGMLREVVLVLNNARIYRRLFDKYRIPEEVQDKILHLMDKKLYDEARDLAASHGGSELSKTLEVLWDSPADTQGAFETLAPIEKSSAEAVAELEKLTRMINEYEPEAKIRIDLSFARGLAYYTGIIYEVKIPGYPVSIAGGGRYDNLVEIYGGEHVPGTGFAIGLDRTLLAAKELGIELSLEKPYKVKAAVIALHEGLIPYAARVLDGLPPWVSATLLPAQKLHKALQRVAKEGYDYAIIVGERERAEETVTVKNLRTREQRSVKVSELEKALPVHTLS